MAEAVHRDYPLVDVRVEEIMIDYGFQKQDSRHKNAWKHALRNPWTIVWAQHLVDRFPSLTVLAQRRFLRSFARVASERLTADKPDLVVANHAWLTVALTLAQTAFGLNVPVLTFETSTINANGLWADRNAERFMVGSDVSQKRLRRFGIRGDRIDVVGYPVRRAFLEAPESTKARVALGLDHRFTVLVLLGGEGVGGAPERLVETLCNMRPELQIVVIAGRNGALYEGLKQSYPNTPRLRVVGFTDNMATYVAASDVTIAKTGPATVYEILAVGRPIIAPWRFGGVENVLINFLEQTGLGHYAPNASSLARTVRRYQDSVETRQTFASRVKALDFDGMSSRIAQYIYHYANNRRVDVNVVGRGLPLVR
jgi:UDP-N-acetylglucosamine:LPS N-acetylglucosamine transferase